MKQTAANSLALPSIPELISIATDHKIAACLVLVLCNLIGYQLSVLGGNS